MIVTLYTSYWLIAASACLLFELTSPGFFYFLSPACGALLTAVLAQYGATIMAQWIVFLMSSLFIFFLLLKMVNKMQKTTHGMQSNVYALIGKHGVVVSGAGEQVVAQVRLGGQLWSARSEKGDALHKGAKVVVKQVIGVTLVVDVV